MWRVNTIFHRRTEEGNLNFGTILQNEKHTHVYVNWEEKVNRSSPKTWDSARVKHKNFPPDFKTLLACKRCFLSQTWHEENRISIRSTRLLQVNGGNENLKTHNGNTSVRYFIPSSVPTSGSIRASNPPLSSMKSNDPSVNCQFGTSVGFNKNVYYRLLDK